MEPQVIEAPKTRQPVIPQQALGVTKGVPALMPERMGASEERRHDWVVDLPMTVSLAEACEPSYWAHVADQMTPMDHIEVRAEDGSWVADLIVAYCERNYAKVVVKSLTQLDADHDAPVTSIKHKVEWKGGVHKYCVIRISDDKMLQSGMLKKSDAIAWLTEHERTVGR